MTDSDEVLFELPHNGPGIRTLSTAESERLKSQHGVHNSVRPCLTCNDLGRFKWYDRFGASDTPGSPVMFRCPCTDQWILHRYFSAHGIGLAYQRLSGADATGVEPEAAKVIMDWFQNREAYIRAGIGLVLHGQGGTGKTLSASMIAKRVLSDGGDAFMLTFKDLLDYQSNGWRDKDERDWFNRRIRSAGLLVIDDIGKENHTRSMKDGKLNESVTTNYAQSTLDTVLRSRVADALPTVVTTNIDFDNIDDAYSASIFDLLVECSLVHRFIGSSNRNLVRNRVVEEAKNGLIRPIVSF